MNKIKTLLLAVTLIASSTSFAQKNYDYGSDSVACIQNLSLFNEFMKQEAGYSDAYRPWLKCIEICPASRKGLYTSGVKMMKSMIADPLYASRKEALIDSLFLIYDMRIATFGREGFVLGRKANEMLTYRPKQVCEAKDVYKHSIDVQKDKSEASVISNYYRSLYECYKKGDVELEVLFNEYLVLSDYININIERYGAQADSDAKAAKKRDRYVSAKNNLDEFFVQFADCADIERIFDQRLKENPNDMDLKKKALRIMSRKDCTENAIYLTLAKAVHAAEPSSESAFAIARKEAKDGSGQTALNYMKEALDLCTDCADRVNYLKYAGYYAGNAGQVSTMRGYANEIMQREPSNGHAYILKGDAARSAANSCDDGKAGRYGAYWVAADYYARAKSKDRSETVKKIATQKLNSAAAQFPTKEEMFFVGLKEGQSYTSSCLGETTTVRLR